MKNIKKMVVDDSGLLKSGSLFLAGSIIVAIANYFYHLFMGRLLGPYDYGILASLFAIIYLTMFSNNVFNLVVARYAAEFHGKNQVYYLKSLVMKALKFVLFYGFIALLVYMVLTPGIARFMNLDSNAGLLIVGIAVYFSLVSTVIIGTLNGMQKFGWQNIVNVSSATVKVFLAVLLVYLGFGVNGALIAIVFGLLAGISVGYFSLRRNLDGVDAREFDTKKVYKYALPVLFSALFSMAIITADQILVKHYFSSADAGMYAAAGVIAKVIWFLSGFLIPVMFPKIVRSAVMKKPDANLFRRALSYTGIIALAGVAAYYVMPGFIIRMLYGNAYVGVANLIWLFGLGMGLFALTQIFVTYNLACGRRGFIWILFSGFVFEVIGIVLFHGSLSEVISVFFVVNLLILVNLLLYNRKEVFYAE